MYAYRIAHRLLCIIRLCMDVCKVYCICLYDASLWKHYHRGALNKLRSCYNRCNKLFAFKRWDSLTNILLTLGLLSFDTVLTNGAISFLHTFFGFHVTTV